MLKRLHQWAITGAKTEANCATYTPPFPFDISTQLLQIDKQNKKIKCLEMNKEYVGVQFVVFHKVFILK